MTDNIHTIWDRLEDLCKISGSKLRKLSDILPTVTNANTIELYISLIREYSNIYNFIKDSLVKYEPDLVRFNGYSSKLSDKYNYSKLTDPSLFEGDFLFRLEKTIDMLSGFSGCISCYPSYDPTSPPRVLEKGITHLIYELKIKLVSINKLKEKIDANKRRENGGVHREG